MNTINQIIQSIAIDSVHNDTVTIVATDIAGNETERSITVSVKIWAQGFAINGENAGEWSGLSVSTAGDVNGDGLADLIVGVHKADLSGKSDTGRSYVVFGKTDNTAINLSAIVIRFTCVYCATWVSITSTNNQIIQSIAIDIACVGD
jgi:hypothetical protein